MSETELRDWIRDLPRHPHVSRADEMKRKGMIDITHWVRTIHPHEAGLFAFLDPQDLKVYAVAYVARG